MGAVVHLTNPFDPLVREVYRVHRPMTVRRLVSRAPALRRHTSVRQIKTEAYGGRRVREFIRPTVCLFNGKPLKRADWSRTVIRETDTVLFFTPPAGGGASGAIIGVVLAIAIAVAAPYLAPILAGAVFGSAAVAAGGAFAAGSLGLSLLTAGIGLALGAAAMGIMSLFSSPPPQVTNQNSGYGGTAQSSPTYSSTGFQQNTARLDQPIPVLYGRHMVVPDYIMPPYARYVGNKQYIHTFLCVTQGRCSIEATRIGDTPISSYASIVTQQVEPGEVPDPNIVDTRFLPCRDIAQVELPATNDTGGNVWKGPYIANPSGTVIDYAELDFIAPRGLYAYSGGGFAGRTATVEIEAQQIDAQGDPIGDWTAIDIEPHSAADNAPQRYTHGYDLPAVGRWQFRTRRTNAKDMSVSSGDQIDWAGLRGRLTTTRSYAGLTGIAIKMEATGDLNGQTSRQVNVIATRLLPTWNGAGMSEEEAPTRSLCDAFVDIAHNEVYGAGQPYSRIDLAGIYSSKQEFADLGWSFDFVFDQTVTCWEALARVARASIAERVVQGGKLRLVRDVPVVAPAMMFTPRNIRPGSFSKQYKLPDETTADMVIGTYMNPNSWKPATVKEAFDDSPRRNPATIQFHGVTHRPQARAMAWYRIRENRYRRGITSLGTEMEGFMVLYGDGCAVSHDMPAWGQSAEVIEWDAATRTMTLTDGLDWSAGGAHYVAISAPNGTMAGPFAAADGGDDGTKLIVGAGTLPRILTDGRQERTKIMFGKGEGYAKRLKAIAVQPRDETTVDLVMIDDDPRMYDPIPEEVIAPGLPDGGVGAPQTPIVIHVSADTANLNLRTLANANGYTGLPQQAVTIHIDAGVNVYATGTSVAALIRGSWPVGAKPVLVNAGIVSGAGGAGGAGATGAGGAGGAALDASSGPIEIENSSGVIRGGGGGGGGGGNGNVAGAGGGGGGQGFNNAPGGRGYPAGPSFTGGAGSANGPGTGGAGASIDVYSPPVGEEPAAFLYTSIGGAGGAGGTWGTAGSNGLAGSEPGSPPMGKGAAGAAVVGNANITWTSVGTRVGPIT